jgi:hypothetical protein
MVQMVTVALMSSLSLARPAHRRLLRLGGKGDDTAKDLRDNLSGIAGRDGWLWLAGDEGRCLHHLGRDGTISRHKLKPFGLAGDESDGESDLEGLALDGDRLWLVGSHSLRRHKHNHAKTPLQLDPVRHPNGQLLGCLQLDGDGTPRAAQRLAVSRDPHDDALTAALAADPMVRPYLAIPSKDNGLDIEGITVRGARVLVGLRGPVLRGIALVADLQLGHLGTAGAPLQLDQLRLRYLDLGGLAVRDLAVRPGHDDVLLLAGPTMTLAGPCLLYRWCDALAHRHAGSPDSLTIETPEPLLWIRSGDPGDNHDKPEGLHLQHTDGELIAWIAYDNPSKHRRQGDGVCTHLDGFVVPGVG